MWLTDSLTVAAAIDGKTGASQQHRQPMLTSSSFYGTDYSTYGSDEDYAKKLFMSRSAKVKRWCSLKVDDLEDKIHSHQGKHHRRTSSAASSSSVPVRERRYSTTHLTHVPRDDSNMPTILVTTADGPLDSGKDAASYDMVNNVPWVDWLEEYKVIKAREIRRRSSTQYDGMSEATEETQAPSPSTSTATTGSHQGASVVNRVLSNWWHSVKVGAEHYSRSRRQSKQKSSDTSTVHAMTHQQQTAIPQQQQPDTSMPPPASPSSAHHKPHPTTSLQKRNSHHLSLDLHDLQHPLEGKVVESGASP